MAYAYYGRGACVIIGGGASFDPAIIPRIKHDIIAVNAAIHDSPHAKAFICSDIRFLKWGNNLEAVKRFEGLKVMRCPKESYDLQKLPDVGFLFVRKAKGRSEDLKALGGLCTGGVAINLAYVLGHKPIYLLGYDMQLTGGKANYHDRHKARAGGNYREFAEAITKMGIPNVYNCNPDSALRCFPFANISEVLL